METIEQPRNARSRRTRAALLDAALAVLQEDGYDHMTMPRVAERAGVSRRGAYLHFRSRAELVNELFDHVAATAGLEDSLARVWAAADSVAALTEWAGHLARYHPRLLAVDRAIQRVRHQDAAAARHHERVQRAQYRSCRRLARWLAEEGRLVQPWTVATAADMLWAQVSSEVIGGLLEERAWSTDQLAERLAVMYRHTFVAPGDG